MSARDPNFPVGLAIAPSAPPLLAPDADGPSYPFSPDVVAAVDQGLAIGQYGIAGRVWYAEGPSFACHDVAENLADREASYALIAYVHPEEELWEHDPPFVPAGSEDIALVELGSGTGLVSLEIARQFELSGRQATIVQTDLPTVCQLLAQTTSAYHATFSATRTRVIVQPLAWGNAEHASAVHALLGARLLTHLVCCDLVYFPELLAPLLRALLHLTQPRAQDPTLVIAYKPRSLAKETAFWSALGLWFEYAPVRVRRRGKGDDDGGGGWTLLGSAWDELMFVFSGRRRPESRGWIVPEKDQDLLDGMGAQGSGSRKGDDTFETILLMNQML
jgi:hypothetical protein